MLPPPPGTEPPGGSVVPPDAVTGAAPLANAATTRVPAVARPTNERFIVPSPSATEAGCTAPDESLLIAAIRPSPSPPRRRECARYTGARAPGKRVSLPETLGRTRNRRSHRRASARGAAMGAGDSADRS